MVEEIKGKFDSLFPPSPRGLIYWRDRIASGIKAAGVFLIGFFGYFVDQLYTALPQVKAFVDPYVGTVGVWIVGALIIYLAENYFRKRMGSPPHAPTNAPTNAPANPPTLPPVQLPGPNRGPASPPNSNEVPR